ncbi:HU family DNA-binding protein [Streptomyces sp. NBC_00237]|uniref:HU family DNA-binding protein n=1 Tax=Streptomyces sp. NBC_00237 TaxID=2975687 RepID=UPI00224F35BA|nr:HU family DNA-binding protein [Streptomyces sp. NBC_00237]MCX5203905.1 HU family DNA-binding protein [Streptomyces sp. NBC_00237]
MDLVAFYVREDDGCHRQQSAKDRIRVGNMKKTELIEVIAKRAELTTEQANSALDAFMHAVTDVLAADDSLSLVGFGTFAVKTRSARTGTDQNGKEINVPEGRVPHFAPGKSLKDAVK